MSTSSFTEAEAAVLAAAHIDLAGKAGGADGVELVGRAAARRLLADAFSVDEAAEALLVTAGRVRQRLRLSLADPCTEPPLAGAVRVLVVLAVPVEPSSRGPALPAAVAPGCDPGPDAALR